ncbi:hypothetical protein HPB48_013341 [Haemaphysalis longicornis]|uniref:Uncharacterized protein n=1 Tax=Haemaphysalis longicornis TaxID=44386 RepID=A0A9J6FRP6_HAELO|nr:hypothetical protein HPB48_013341 [Haemaphysalis longicornis]
MSSRRCQYLTMTMSRRSGSLGEREALRMRIVALRAKVNEACRQFVLLDQQTRDLARLCKRAERNNKRALRYSIRLKISIMTGVKMMYDHYITANMDELQRVVGPGCCRRRFRRPVDYSTAASVHD